MILGSLFIWEYLQPKWMCLSAIFTYDNKWVLWVFPQALNFYIGLDILRPYNSESCLFLVVTTVGWFPLSHIIIFNCNSCLLLVFQILIFLVNNWTVLLSPLYAVNRIPSSLCLIYHWCGHPEPLVCSVACMCWFIWRITV